MRIKNETDGKRRKKPNFRLENSGKWREIDEKQKRIYKIIRYILKNPL